MLWCKSLHSNFYSIKDSKLMPKDSLTADRTFFSIMSFLEFYVIPVSILLSFTSWNKQLVAKASMSMQTRWNSCSSKMKFKMEFMFINSCSRWWQRPPCQCRQDGIHVHQRWNSRWNSCSSIHVQDGIHVHQRGDISTLNGSFLKLVDKFTYAGSSVSTTEKDINTRLAKAWTAINRLLVKWKSDLTDKIKCSFSKQRLCWYCYMDALSGH